MPPMLRSRLLLVLVTGIVIGLSLSLAANVIAGRRSEGAMERATALPWEDARLLAEVLHRIESDYVDPVTAPKLMENAVRGMVGALDPHSAFLDATEYDEMQAETSGSYPGIGIEVAATPHGVEVMQPIDGSPAATAGLRTGDLIIAIDGKDVVADALDAAIAALRGPAGSTVNLSVRRTGLAAPLDFSIRRTQVAVHSVQSEMLEPGFVYLRIESFSETTAHDVAQALHEFTRQSPPALRGLIIDLRNNPGGLLESAVEIADDFLDRGNIVSADGRTEDARFRMDAKPGDLTSGAPIRILVNGNSASAAEILAGALKDNHRALLIGRRTYGKGSVQTVIPLSSGRALKLTTSRYFTPSGASINQIGIEPDLAYDGEDLPPAALDAAGAAHTLPQRDAQVALALDGLKQAPRRVAGLTAP
jgi:carboxyl-terminal processing protease